MQNRVAPGSKIPWGSYVDLVIGSGLTEERILVPSVTGLTLAEARVVLEESGIIIGAVIPEASVRDTSAAFVYKQSPPKLTEDNQPSYIKSGQLMDLWISVEKKVIDSTQTQ